MCSQDALLLISGKSRKAPSTVKTFRIRESQFLGGLLVLRGRLQLIFFCLAKLDRLEPFIAVVVRKAFWQQRHRRFTWTDKTPVDLRYPGRVSQDTNQLRGRLPVVVMRIVTILRTEPS